MKTVLAIVIIGILIAFAMWLGFNSAILATGVAVIAGLGGYQARRIKAEKETRNDKQREHPPNQ